MGVATAAAVAGATVAAGSAIDARNSRKDAAKDVEDANIKSATQLAAAGKAGENDINVFTDAAERELIKGGQLAANPLRNAAKGRRLAFQDYYDQTMSSDDANNPLTDLISRAARKGVDSNTFDLSPTVRKEIGKQSSIIKSGFTPAYNEILRNEALNGYQADVDIGGIRQRMNENIAQLRANEGAQIATSLIGQTPALQELGAKAQQARMLSNTASRNFNSNIAEIAAQNVGRYAGSR